MLEWRVLRRAGPLMHSRCARCCCRGHRRRMRRHWQQWRVALPPCAHAPASGSAGPLLAGGAHAWVAAWQSCRLAVPTHSQQAVTSRVQEWPLLTLAHLWTRELVSHTRGHSGTGGHSGTRGRPPARAVVGARMIYRGPGVSAALSIALAGPSHSCAQAGTHRQEPPTAARSSAGTSPAPGSCSAAARPAAAAAAPAPPHPCSIAAGTAGGAAAPCCQLYLQRMRP